MSDVTDRLDALEAALKANQLPDTYAILQRKLEQNWQPDASVLLQPGTIIPALLSGVVDSDGKGLTFGTTRVRWGLDNTPPTSPATADTQAAAVAHGMGKTPLAVVATVGGGAFAAALSAKTTNLTASAFDLRVSSNITITFTVGCYWIAVG